MALGPQRLFSRVESHNQFRLYLFLGVFKKFFRAGHAAQLYVHSRALDSCVLSSSSPLVPCTVSNRVPERSAAARLTTQLRCTSSIAQTGGVAGMSQPHA